MGPGTRKKEVKNVTEEKKRGGKIHKKRKLFNYKEEDLKRAIDAINIDKIGVRQACRNYGVPRATVQDRLSGRVVVDQIKPRKVGPDPVLGFEGENKIVEWIIDMAKCGIPITKAQLMETVKNICKDMGEHKISFTGQKPAQSWFRGFCKRHPEISIREPEGINKARESVKEGMIRKWFEDLEVFLSEKDLLDMMKDPERVFNADETGVSLCPKTGKVLAPKGYKNVYTVTKGNDKETITVLNTINAAGKICPPLVVFPYIRPPKAIVVNMPEKWVVGKTESGWMRSDVFYEYMANDFNNWILENNIKKPVILFVDGHKSHMTMQLSQFCDDNDIVLYALPPNTTHITQPADVSVFRPLKQAWKKTVSNWQSRPENMNKTVTKTNFCKVFQETLDNDMTQSIRNGFRKCGLYPFDVEAIDYSKCVKDFQEKKKKRPSSSGELTERDFESALKVVNYIKENLLKSSVDLNVVIKEIEKARTESKERRRSASKTPRKSTEVVKTIEKAINPTQNESNYENVSFFGDIPDVGSLVSIDDISIIDLNLNNYPIDTQENNLTQRIDTPQEEHDNVLTIITSADIHCKEHLKDHVESRETIPKTCTSTALKSAVVNNDTIIESQDHVINTVANNADPFDKHLKFIETPSGGTAKKRNMNRLPSAISAKKWREFYELKDIKKRNIEEEKQRKKTEREKKKNENAEMKQAEKKKRKKNDQIKLTVIDTDSADDDIMPMKVKPQKREEFRATRPDNVNTKTGDDDRNYSEKITRIKKKIFDNSESDEDNIKKMSVNKPNIAHDTKDGSSDKMSDSTRTIEKKLNTMIPEEKNNTSEDEDYSIFNI